MTDERKLGRLIAGFTPEVLVKMVAAKRRPRRPRRTTRCHIGQTNRQ